jgi:hypothetical protein
MALNIGICEQQEILQAVRFLNDLGSLQYFEDSSLKDKVVVNPQWIVDVMTSIISVKETCIIDGRLYHDDIKKIWHKYDESLHEWILKLTEEFDLTFPVSSKRMNLVPCLLPDKEPENKWPEIDQNTVIKIKEYHVNYNFGYLPIGLFNRIQVRLFQYADDTIIWKNGSFLRKNNHIALIIQTKKFSIQVKVQGVKPENIVFVIHEVIESLINESFNGIKYDYSFPCPDCVNEQSLEPSMFSSTLLRRAHQFKAPFLQCHKFFHAVSIQEMLAIMPIDGLSSVDLNLEYSLRDLKQLKNKLKYDALFWYCMEDVPKSDEDEKCSCSPLKLLESLKQENYVIWCSTSPREQKMDQLTYAIKESKMVILAISDNFAKDEKCMQVFELVKSILKKSYLIVEMGKLGEHKWLENPVFASVCSDCRVIMQDPRRYPHKLAEVVDSLERQIKDIRIDKEMRESPPDVFISYCWANSHDAVKKGTKSTQSSLGKCVQADLF